MSERFEVGDTVIKAENAGFIGGKGLYQIIDDGFDYWSPCLYCGDEECREWNTLWEVNELGQPTGAVACHVPECMMKARGEEV
jgi:hypothetical protein